MMSLFASSQAPPKSPPCGPAKLCRTFSPLSSVKGPSHFGVLFLTSRADCLNRAEYDSGHGPELNPYPGHTFSTDEGDYGGFFDPSESNGQHPFQALKKLLNTGNFYYSADFDLTRRLQDRIDI